MTATVDPMHDLITEPLRSRRNHWNNQVRRHAYMTPDRPALKFGDAVTTWSALEARSRAFAAGDEIRRMLPHVKLPLKAIWGARDQIALPSVEARFGVLREAHPELDARVVENAGHWAAYEQPEVFNATLLDVLGS